ATGRTEGLLTGHSPVQNAEREMSRRSSSSFLPRRRTHSEQKRGRESFPSRASHQNTMPVRRCVLSGPVAPCQDPDIVQAHPQQRFPTPFPVLNPFFFSQNPISQRGERMIRTKLS